jgi:hypothetical protein
MVGDGVTGVPVGVTVGDGVILGVGEGVEVVIVGTMVTPGVGVAF